MLRTIFCSSVNCIILQSEVKHVLLCNSLLAKKKSLLMMISPYLKRRIPSIQLIIKLHVHIQILFLVKFNLLYWNMISWSPITECYYNSWNGVGWGVAVAAGVTTSLFIFLLLLLYTISASQITDYFSNGICILTVSTTYVYDRWLSMRIM